MRRRNRLLVSALNALCYQLDKQQDIYFRERPWLETGEIENRVISPLKSEEKDCKMKIRHTLEYIQELLTEAQAENLKKQKEYIVQQALGL